MDKNEIGWLKYLAILTAACLFGMAMDGLLAELSRLWYAE